MSSIFWILGGFLANMIIGASVWAAIDDDQQSLLRWYHECPPQIAWLAQPLALTAWPIALWFWRKNKRNNDEAHRRDAAGGPSGGADGSAA